MQSRAPYLFPLGARMGQDNLVLHATAKRHSVRDYSGPLSIKMVRRGRVSWLVNGRELVVDPSSFLVLAAGERYSMNIDAPQPVETGCAFFVPGFLERIAMDLTSSVDAALDAPNRTGTPLAYLSAFHRPRERTLNDRLWTLASRCEVALSPSGAEEDFLLLGTSLLDCYAQIRAESARVPALGSSTRQELFRRLLIGREFLHAHSSEPISLAGVARASFLSPFHFHRGFTRAFGDTPHNYLTGLRLLQARSLLERGSSVLSACLEVGFSSPSYFSRLFRARMGCLPSMVRLKFARLSKTSASKPGIVVS